MKHYKPALPKTQHVAQNLYIMINGIRISISPEEIIYLEASINYTTFHTRNNKFTSAFHLKFFDEVLKEHTYFVRINKSYILNLNYLEALNWKRDTKEVRLADGTMLPISRRRASGIKDMLWKKLNT
ncbi:LytTR family DNA-binding domain-containing protein [Emticicia sp. TH156]|uniref:LytR/AlgR family response regulator transcription factor n=1 Tax=Emticicia sp. TH156 TaxID=2067454 RepID=UPI000C772AA9|nr:LytTR family DNA-binding domain-containing protein [Emticicia sp. TH156]PLK45247.1 hypothetical protein C0V77_08460 [Emticicia sp. TH156]